MNKIKILFITCNDIKNIYYGGAKASARNYECLAKHGDVKTYLIQKRSNFKSMLSLLSGYYPPINYKNKEDIKKIIIEEKIQLIFCDGSFYGKLLDNIVPNGVKVIVFCHNCESDYNKVRFCESGFLKRIIYQSKIDVSERKILQKADVIAAFSQRDSQRLQELYNVKKIFIVPLGIKDTNKSVKQSDYKEAKNCLLFGPIGSANYEAFRWFIKNVSPYLNCRTIVAGKGFENHRKEFESDKVQVLGYVDNLDDLYKESAVVAIPLLSGSGMKIKTAEAMMYGRYIVGTDEAFAGYNIDFDKIGGLCNTAEAFVKKINILIQKVDCFNEYARECYVKNYSIESGYKAFDKLIDEVFQVDR